MRILPRLCPSQVSWMKRNKVQVNSASCIFFSPAAPSEPTPSPSAFVFLSNASRSNTLNKNKTYSKFFLILWLNKTFFNAEKRKFINILNNKEINTYDKKLFKPHFNSNIAFILMTAKKLSKTFLKQEIAF